MHYMGKSRATAKLRMEVVALLSDTEFPELKRIRVDCEWVVKTKAKRDPDNLAPMLKAIYDAIGSDRGVGAHLVADDSPEYMEKVGATIRYDKDAEPHFVITITDLGENT